MKLRHGWIRSIRKSKTLTFLAVTSGSEEFQVTIKHDECEVIGDLVIGSSFSAHGTDNTTPRGDYEFKATKVELVGKSDDNYPIQPKFHTPEFLRNIPQLRIRDREMLAIMHTRSELSFQIHQFMRNAGFSQFFTPLITSDDCEGAGEQFIVKSDWLTKSLTVSGQLHAEVGMMGMGQVYTFGPCFRAEKSSTRKHLAEFWMVEPEMMHYDLEQTMDFAEKFIKTISTIAIYNLSKSGYWNLLKHKGVSEYKSSIFKSDFVWGRITYQDVCDIFGLEYGKDIGAGLEQKIVQHFHRPMFITHWPKELKPFYMKRKDGEALCFDLIFPEVGELVGGSVREEDYDTLQLQLEENMHESLLRWYLDTRKWGTVPHSGFGMGFERLLMFLTDAEKVHDVIPFPINY